LNQADGPFFDRVEPHQIGEVWEFVGAGLAVIAAECPTVPWYPRDVKRCLLKGQAALYVRPEGFVILQRCEEPISGAPYLNVWAIWFRPGTASPLRQQLIEWLDYSCRATCCEWWEGTSTREGWGRALESVCDEAMVTWRRRP
jgi:hypothetical protein